MPTENRRETLSVSSLLAQELVNAQWEKMGSMSLVNQKPLDAAWVGALAKWLGAYSRAAACEVKAAGDAWEKV